ncbi:unnamed protein product [Blepharisma stoltei]|uniref:RING-CH-type domain-containing protein n=1 Tax=Blepharisma stoltei TaxID=1481888 RepID=A0AAU9I9R5_9CILI|nr:unnamed protein product [Blepharisma stoltei]
MRNSDSLSRADLARRSWRLMSKNNKVLPFYLSSDSSFRSSKNNANAEKLCKICFDSETETHALISPCQCSGSIKYIHQECLKAWLLSKNEDLSSVTCELCKTPYLMTYDICNKCKPQKKWCDPSRTVYTVILFVLFVLVLLTMLLISQNILIFSGKWGDVYKNCLYVVCTFFDTIIFLTLLKVQKESCFESTLTNWKILDYPLEQVENKYLKAENTNMELISSSIYKIPEDIIISGKRVKAPSIFPRLIPIIQGGKLTGYSHALSKSDCFQLEKIKEMALHSEPSSVVNLKSCPDEKRNSCNESVMQNSGEKTFIS